MVSISASYLGQTDFYSISSLGEDSPRFVMCFIFSMPIFSTLLITVWRRFLTAVTRTNYFFWDMTMCRDVPMFRRIILPPSSARTKQQASATSFLLLSACFFAPEDEVSTFLQNVGELVPDYTTLHPKRRYAS
jgi:hypothetical protein